MLEANASVGLLLLWGFQSTSSFSKRQKKHKTNPHTFTPSGIEPFHFRFSTLFPCCFLHVPPCEYATVTYEEGCEKDSAEGFTGFMMFYEDDLGLDRIFIKILKCIFCIIIILYY